MLMKKYLTDGKFSLVLQLPSLYVLNANQFKYLPKTSIKHRNENIKTFCLDLKCKTCICDTIDCLRHEGPKV
jgi:hypothetical protein